MKQTILILIFSTFIFTGCGGNNNTINGDNGEIVGGSKTKVTIDVNAS